MNRFILPTLQINRNIYNLKGLKARYKRLNKASNKKNHPENVEFIDAMSLFKNYTLGLDLPISLHINMLDSCISGKTFKGEVLLPKAVGKQQDSIVMVFAQDQFVEKARSLGATIVGGVDLIQKLSDPEYMNSLKVDKVFCTSEMFPHVVKIAKLLGPKGLYKFHVLIRLMPSPSKKTVGDNLDEMMKTFQAANSYECDADKFIHMEVGQTTWSDQDLLKNIISIIESIQTEAKARGKVQPISMMHISSFFTPALRLPYKKIQTLVDKKNQEED